MTFIVHGATGAQGAPVLAALRAAGHAATAAVRDVSRTGSTGVAVDLASVDSLVAAYDGADGVFVHLPLGSPDRQLAQAEAVADAVARAKPARVVFSTSGSTTAAPGNEHLGADVLARRLLEGDVPAAVVEPRLFLENLLLPFLLDPVRSEGVLRYPLRADHATSWSSHLDVAEVVVRLLTDPTAVALTGVVSVGALPGLVGDDLAAGFAEHLGRDVTYEPLDPERFGDLLAGLVGEPTARAVAASYAAQQTAPDHLVPEATSAQRRLGTTPRTVTRWLADLKV